MFVLSVKIHFFLALTFRISIFEHNLTINSLYSLKLYIDFRYKSIFTHVFLVSGHFFMGEIFINVIFFLVEFQGLNSPIEVWYNDFKFVSIQHSAFSWILKSFRTFCKLSISIYITWTWSHQSSKCLHILCTRGKPSTIKLLQST